MPASFFTKEELFFMQQDALTPLRKLNDLVTKFNDLVGYLGNRVFAKDTNDTACVVTGVNTTVGTATADEDNTSTGTVTSGGTYTGATDSVYTFEVVTSCTTPGTITGMTFKWKKDSGEFSEDVSATGSAQVIDSGVTIKFEVSAGEDFVVGDVFNIAVTTYKIDIATGYYLYEGTKKLLVKVEDKIIPVAHTKVFINPEGIVETATVLPSDSVSLATVASSAGSVTVTDARKYLV